jgi:hypothetical protein
VGTLIVSVLAGIIVGWRFWRWRETRRYLYPALWMGLGFALLHMLYFGLRVDNVTITTKQMVFRILPSIATLCLIFTGTILFFSSKTRFGKLIAFLVLSFRSSVPAIVIVLSSLAFNLLISTTETGTGLYNYNLGLIAWPAMLVELTIFIAGFRVLRVKYRIGDE